MDVTKRINPIHRVGRVLVEVLPALKPYRVLVDEAAGGRVVVSVKIVMQPGLAVEVLALEAEFVVDQFDVGTGERAVGAVTGRPDDAALRVGHFSRGAEVVEVVVVDGGLPLCVAVDASQGAEAVRLE